MSGLEVLGAIAGGIQLANYMIKIAKKVRRLSLEVKIARREIGDLADELFCLSNLMIDFEKVIAYLNRTSTVSDDRNRQANVAQRLSDQTGKSLSKLGQLLKVADPLLDPNSTIGQRGYGHWNWWREKESVVYLKTHIMVIKDTLTLFVAILLLQQTIDGVEVPQGSFSSSEIMALRIELIRAGRRKVNKGIDKLQNLYIHLNDASLVARIDIEDILSVVNDTKLAAQISCKTAKLVQDSSATPSTLSRNASSSNSPITPRDPDGIRCYASGRQNSTTEFDLPTTHSMEVHPSWNPRGSLNPFVTSDSLGEVSGETNVRSQSFPKYPSTHTPTHTSRQGGHGNTSHRPIVTSESGQLESHMQTNTRTHSPHQQTTTGNQKDPKSSSAPRNLKTERHDVSGAAHNRYRAYNPFEKSLQSDRQAQHSTNSKTTGGVQYRPAGPSSQSHT
ncbi:hypothetical protein EJ05DRAFT_502846 [Pseudovirgaria hyperparasitica]|uniref:Fungal N-terminal domain-containing protein n=1 Tax=Pseudovirgaria hyperparasitica TaxID=470096 RepID=A0A6A6W2X1_9PEZI|nr:uncharacterized protein EJ05DRAFT_502846 [Pseudovirgaria hyperparasitica]KAF2755381.1 hypothetical protein EJ05DRAFT_502846 [Pseudovirgaria hyperparasitica]